ncbi:BUD13 homolog [Physella acuta]|uniref:BUD13 homolog n=1 Tax=Physella acuta TaxID=109671 RepID=UPI0027DD5121|nr:BUD13 homolog [Physella acuta]
MSSPGMSKADYLKRYLSNDELPKEEKKKKRRKIKTPKESKLRIIDDDIDLKELRVNQASEELFDDAPTVADVVDERPKHVQLLEQYRKNSRWKVLGEDDEDGTSALDYGVIATRASHHDSDRDVTSSVGGKSKENSRSKLLEKRSGVQNETKRHNPDQSPIRHMIDSPINKRVRNSTDQLSPRNHSNRHDSGSDNSPPRNHSNRHDSGSDNSPPRNHSNRHDSGSDYSPPRNHSNRHDSGSDNSPPRNHSNRHDSGSDNSPPRNHSKRYESRGMRKMVSSASVDHGGSPPARALLSGGLHRPLSDSSPPGRDQSNIPSKSGINGHLSDPHTPQNLNPSEKKSNSSESDLSPPRLGKRSSPPYKRTSPDQSPPRKKRAMLISPCERDGESKKAKKTLGGAKAGLSTAQEMKDETQKLREKENKSFQMIGSELLGKNSKTVFRDKETGRRRNLKEEEERKQEEEKRKEETNKKYQRWGKGVKQQADREARLEDDLHEASKPLARYADDKDLDKMLREEERADDPMLAYIQSQKKKVEDKCEKSKRNELPRYKGPAPPPNRYNIPPGYRWDGVNRSNGFENKIFASLANKKATQELAYKWSTEDM